MLYMLLVDWKFIVENMTLALDGHAQGLNQTRYEANCDSSGNRHGAKVL